MTTVHLFPINRWRGADPDTVIDRAEREGMSIDEALDFADEIAEGVDRTMLGIGFSCEQRRAALAEWHGYIEGGLICYLPRRRQDRSG